MRTLPVSVLSYIREHYREAERMEPMPDRDAYGKPLWRVRLYKGDHIYLLYFSDKGSFLKKESLPKFEDDYFEGGYYGED